MKQDVAQEMLAILSSDRRWCKNAYAAGPRVCLTAARLRAAGQVNFSGEEIDLDSDPYLRLLAQVIREQFPDRARAAGVMCPSSCKVAVIWFNDHEDTHFGDVRAVLEKAAARWGEGG